jgi:hypothetical protein
VTNTGSTATTAHLYIANNLGSDNNTIITGSSSGDAAGTTADSWVGTMQNYSGNTSSDPRLAHVLGGTGAGADAALAEANFANGDDNPYWNYSVDLAPGQTKTIVNYAVVATSKAEASTSATALAKGGAYACMTPTEIAQVANFDVTGPVLHLPSATTVKATSSTGAPVTYTATATDAVDGTTPVTCTPPSGSVFPVGTTTVNCTTKDAAGNTTTGSFTVTVSPAPAVTVTVNDIPKISHLKVAPARVGEGGKVKASFKLAEAYKVKLKIISRDRKPIFLNVMGKKGMNEVTFSTTIGGVKLLFGKHVLVVKAIGAGGATDKAASAFLISGQAD